MVGAIAVKVASTTLEVVTASFLVVHLGVMEALDVEVEKKGKP